MKLPCVNCFSSAPGTDRSRQETEERKQENFRVFSYNELKSATNGFHPTNKIGEGGFGIVYKGQLRDGSLVAVKVLSIELESMRGEREFISEIATLCNIQHENLVTFRGCCVEGARRYIVYDFMENNSLAHTLLGAEQNRSRFSWETRRDISIGVARALAYLLEEVEPHIIHRDIKAGNILLDGNFRPKVSDFGLAKLLGDSCSHVSTRVAGTLGYLAPEYAVSGRLTRKSDVYSFGVLLLEIVSGRPVVDFDLDYRQQYLVQKVTKSEQKTKQFPYLYWLLACLKQRYRVYVNGQAWEAYEANDLLQLVDPTLDNNFPETEAVRFLKVGLLCVQEASKLRPQMSTVVEMLAKDEIKDINISEPGLVVDLMNIRLRQKQLAGTSSSSFGSSISSSVNVGR